MELKYISDEDKLVYRHSYQGKVQFSEVDSFGVVHNLKYLYWLEWARTDYLRKIGVNINPQTFLTEHPFMSVHSEIDYFSPCRFDDQYTVLTRIKWIKNSSFCFDNLVYSGNGILLVRGSTILVLINPKTGESIRISDSLRDMIKAFEKDNVKFLD